MIAVTISETFVVPDEATASRIANELVVAAGDIARGNRIALVRGETTLVEWDGPDFPLLVRAPKRGS